MHPNGRILTRARHSKRTFLTTKTVIVAGGALAVAAVVAAAVLLQQDIVTSASAGNPDVVFGNGEGYDGINGAGYATLTLGSSATSATLAVVGVPGASELRLDDLINITNQGDADYSVTLVRSQAPDEAISEFTLRIMTAGGQSVAVWDASSAASTSFTLPAATTYEVSLDLVVVDGTAVGPLSGFTLQFQLAPL